MRATVVTDASFWSARSGAPGFGGWAAWVRVDDIPQPIKGYGSIREPITNSSEAETCAALNGIFLARNRGALEILLRTDCMAVVHLIQGRVKAGSLLRLWDRAMALPIYHGMELRVAHVGAHGNHDASDSRAAWVNDWCDKHAGIAMRKARKGEECRMLL